MPKDYNAPEYAIEQLVAIAQRIAQHLPASSLGRWQITKNKYGNRYATFSRGEFAFELGQVSYGNNEGRLCISGEYNNLHTFNHGTQDPYMPTRTYAHDRPPEKIAADIITRFLPAYYEAYTVLKGRKLARDESNARLVQNAKTLCEASGGWLKMPEKWRGDDGEIRFNPYISGDRSGYINKCNVSSSEKFYIDINSLPLPIANILVAVLGSYEQGDFLLTEEERAHCPHPFTFGAVCMSCGAVTGGFEISPQGKTENELD